MSENNGAAAQSGQQNNSSTADTATKTPGQNIQAGQPTVAAFTPRKTEAESTSESSGTNNNQNDGNGQQSNAGDNGDGKNQSEAKQPEAVTEEGLKKYFEQQGIKWDGNVETLKEKLADKPADPTEEQKQEAAKKLEARMYAHYEKHGGDMAKFVALKNLASMENLKDLSVQQIKEEMKGKFDEDEINAIIAERYYQINPEELEQGVDESDEDFQKRKEKIAKKVAHFDQVLTNRGASFRDKAKQALEQLRQAIEAEDLLAQEEEKFSSKVDEHLKTLSRELTFEIGKVGDVVVDPIVFKITEEDIAKVAEILKDPVQREQLFYNPEGNGTNLPSVANLLLKNQILETAVKKALIEGGDRQVAIFEKTFPARSGQGLGVGGSNKQSTSKKGENITAGQPEPVIRN